MDNIYIKNKENLEKKIKQIKNDGAKNLHVIADFDRTLTKGYLDGRESLSLFAEYRLCVGFGDEYNKKYDAMYDYYHPIEMNHDLPLDYRYKMMEKWWTEYVDLDVAFGSNQDLIEKTLNKIQLKFRQGSKEFFDTLLENNIPLLIFSGGIRDYIKGMMKRHNLVYNNISIIANDFNFDSKGKLKGIKGKIVHTYNKGEVAIKDDSHYAKINQRKNIILLGDHLGDLKMAEGIKHKTKITIGFYNDKDNKHLQKYIDEFDIVICNDGSFDYINDLLRKVLEN